MSEQWATIPEFEGLYEASDAGRVRRLARSRVLHHGRTAHWGVKILTPARFSGGYLGVGLYVDGVHHNRTVHTLVLAAFRGPRPEGHQGAHEDGDKNNNTLSNLTWKTPTANCADKRRHGTDQAAFRASSLRWRLLAQLRPLLDLQMRAA